MPIAAGTIIRGFGILSLLALGACVNSRPATLVLPSGDVLQGGASTSLNGQYFVKNQRVSCTGTYEGRNVAGIAFSVGRKATVTVNCSDGKVGVSQDAFYNTGTAQLTFSDGSRGRLTFRDAP